MPHQCRTIPESMDAAVARYESGTVESSWSDAGPIPGDPDWAGGTQFMDERDQVIDAPLDAVWREICAIGGERGYHTSNFLWHLRGVMDRMLGGPGLRRGRRNPTDLRMGDAVDFWRVTAIEPGKRLELTAEMLLPGVATLTLSVEPATGGGTHLALKARFRPRGLFGIAYWWAVYPLHGIVFPGMLRGIGREAKARAAKSIAA
jgi:hypothetical protein